MFAKCISYKDTPLLKTLPSGKYLCINAKESELEKAQNTLINIVKEKYTVWYPDLIEYENKYNNNEYRPLLKYI